jgi:hypothetical protein
MNHKMRWEFIMKKLILGLMLSIGLTGVSVFAWEPEDLTKFPSGQEAGTKILNFGIGFWPDYFDWVNNDWLDWVVPSIHGTFDYNIAIGDRGLPFFAGALFGYSGYGHQKRHSYDRDWFIHNITFGGRFGYHFNWAVDNLDTYAVASTGWTVRASSDETIIKPPKPGIDDFLFGITVGARYFVLDWFGFWAEAGFGTLFSVDIGLAFKF